MAKEKFNWKGLFINDENEKQEKAPKKEAPKASSTITSFPTSDTSASKFPETNVTVSANNDVLNKIIEMYEAGFESLNQPGYDFYEFFKAIKAVGSNSPEVYKMAMTMAKGVDSKVSKSKLLKQAGFYVDEINKVHSQYQSKGNAKKSQIQSSLQSKKDGLINEVAGLEKQLLEIQNQLSVKKNELNSIDGNMMTDVVEIDQKIVANDMAKSKILETINTVVDGIKNNL